MIIETKFNLKQKVKIIELNSPGIIIGFYIVEDHDVQYQVRYFQNGDAKNVYFYEEELCPIRKDSI